MRSIELIGSDFKLRFYHLKQNPEPEREGLTGNCNWEVKWCSSTHRAVGHKAFSRVDIHGCRFGFDNKTRSSECNSTGYTSKSLYFPSQTLSPIEYDIDEGSHSFSSFCAVSVWECPYSRSGHE